MRVSGFYGVVDLGAGDGPDEAARARSLAEALIAGGASVVQLRMKRALVRRLFERGRELAAVCRALGVPFVVNDRLDVALAVGADGVHLGQDDLPLEAARAACRAAGRRLWIGISTHTPAQAEAAARAGADYLGFGPIFSTRTKENPDPPQGLEGLAAAVRAAAGTPVVAIGGLTPAHAPAVARTGAAAACVISAVNHASDVRAAAAEVAAAWRAR